MSDDAPLTDAEQCAVDEQFESIAAFLRIRSNNTQEAIITVGPTITERVLRAVYKTCVAHAMTARIEEDAAGLKLYVND